jgi:hypothetical protein
MADHLALVAGPCTARRTQQRHNEGITNARLSDTRCLLLAGRSTRTQITSMHGALKPCDLRA